MIYVLLVDGFEEIEALTPIDILRRCGAEVLTVGVMGEYVTGSHNICVKADILIDEVKLNEMSCLIIPGGPGYTIPCETRAERQHHDRGVLSMAHRGPNTGGSQFFICHNRMNTQHLDGVHTCFGKVVEGVDVIDDIRPGDLILSVTIVEE